jgi:two-component system phosphate regulon sensor histidine kinase PhoR
VIPKTREGGIVMNGFERFAETAAHHVIADLQRASDFQAAIIGMAGHDLRQPLQIIQGTYELLRTRCGMSEQVWLDRGEQAIGRLTDQLDCLLGAIRFYESAKTLEMMPVALAPLFWQVCNENEDLALRKGIDLRACSTEARVMSNPVLLGSILRNLVTNAVKYTEPGGRVLIGCRRSSGDVRIDVCDTGIGIRPEYLRRIFDAFARVDSGRCEGLGMGLFVVRRAAELLAHRTEISSTVSRGSRFSVFAPRF